MIVKSLMSVVVMRDDLIKLIECEFLVWLRLAVNENTVHQFQQWLVIQMLSNGSGDFLQLFKSDHSWVLLIVQSPNPLKSVSGSVLSDLAANHIHELLKSQNLVSFSQGHNDFQDVLVPLVQTNFFQNFDNLLRINGSTSILVKQEEDISEVFIIFRVDSVSPGSRDLLFVFEIWSLLICWWVGCFSFHFKLRYLYK